MRVRKERNKQISAEFRFRFCWQQLQDTIARGTDSWQLGVCLSSSVWGQQSHCWSHQCHYGVCQRHSCHLSRGRSPKALLSRMLNKELSTCPPHAPLCCNLSVLICFKQISQQQHRSISRHSWEVLHPWLLRTQQTSAPWFQGVLFYIQESRIWLAHMWSLLHSWELKPHVCKTSSIMFLDIPLFSH